VPRLDPASVAGSSACPSPAVMYSEPLPATLTGRCGEPVEVTGRFLLTTAPVYLTSGDQPAAEAVAWAGPVADEQPETLRPALAGRIGGVSLRYKE
jgi:hypothetical protein